MCQWNVVISAKNFEMPRAIQITTLNEILLTLNNIACLAAIITCFFLSFNKKQLFWTYLCFSFLWWKRVFFLKLEVDLLYVKLLTWKKERKDKWCFFFKKKNLQLMEWKKNLLQCQCDSINDMISNQKSIARNTMIIYFEIDFYSPILHLDLFLFQSILLNQILLLEKKPLIDSTLSKYIPIDLCKNHESI